MQEASVSCLMSLPAPPGSSFGASPAGTLSCLCRLHSAPSLVFTVPRGCERWAVT